MHVVVCPDKFAGTLSADAAAAAIALGWLDVRPDDDVVTIPLADGGPGFLDVLHSGLDGVLHRVTVQDPRGRPVAAQWLQVGDTAYVEAAQANGLHLLAETERDPSVTHSAGVGELIAAAADRGVRRIIVGLGGSATNDGGRAAIEVLAGKELPELLVATDVEAPLLGSHGSTYGYALQKGARPEDLPGLEERMQEWALRGPDLVDSPGAGAAGGLGFALMLLGGRRVSGVASVIDALDLGQRIDGADLLITGEGRFDWQSLQGKVIGGLLARAEDTPVVVVAGQVDVDDSPVPTISLAQQFGLPKAINEPEACLRAAVADLAGEWRADRT